MERPMAMSGAERGRLLEEGWRANQRAMAGNARR